MISYILRLLTSVFQISVRRVFKIHMEIMPKSHPSQDPRVNAYLTQSLIRAKTKDSIGQHDL